MKTPKTPPDIQSIGERLFSQPDLISEVLSSVIGPTVEGKYLHWDKLRYRTPPEGINHENWWFGIKMQRRSLSKAIPLNDKKDKPFVFLTVDPIPEILHKIDQGAGGLIEMPDQIANPDTKDRYYISSLIEEAITSSQLEGAATTRKVAKEMLRTGRRPQDHNEQMIMNNYLTMRRIGELKSEPFSKKLIFDIHRIITENILDDESATGRFRQSGEKIVVGDEYGEIFHEPPAADQLEDRLKAMCDFANGKTPDYFIHPIIRAIILHFWLAYDHPFVDGNGRTARALFYWSMLRSGSGYWLFEFVSISQIILKAPAKYGKAFLYTETDDNDLTYFILYHLNIIQQAIKGLHEYIKRKALMLLKDIEKVGVLLDWGHAFQGCENVAESAAILSQYGKLDYLHLNDNYRSWDDDLMVGALHLVEYIELIYWLKRVEYKGWLTLDIFPFREDGVQAVIQSKKWLELFFRAVGKIGMDRIKEVIDKGDACQASEIIRDVLSISR